MRSPTGEEVFSKYEGINAIGCGTNKHAATPVSVDLIEWSDIIFVMEKSHRNKISKQFKPLMKTKRMICLDIPDDFERMDPVLIQIMESKVMRYIHNHVRKST